MKIRHALLTLFLLNFYSCSTDNQNNDMQANLIQGEDFLKNNLLEDGVIEIKSGLQYLVLESGDGESPSLDQTITADFHGTLLDGSVFWSSIDNGEPLVVQLSQLIPGCQESISLMSEGDSWRVFIHPDLAYGEAGRPGIPANSALIFDISLLAVN
jgi:FKBP-type peptidyl-prolyl cis-trans isomerase